MSCVSEAVESAASTESVRFLRFWDGVAEKFGVKVDDEASEFYLSVVEDLESTDNVIAKKFLHGQHAEIAAAWMIWSVAQFGSSMAFVVENDNEASLWRKRFAACRSIEPCYSLKEAFGGFIAYGDGPRLDIVVVSRGAYMRSDVNDFYMTVDEYLSKPYSPKVFVLSDCGQPKSNLTEETLTKILETGAKVAFYTSPRGSKGVFYKQFIGEDTKFRHPLKTYLDHPRYQGDLDDVEVSVEELVWEQDIKGTFLPVTDWGMPQLPRVNNLVICKSATEAAGIIKSLRIKEEKNARRKRRLSGLPEKPETVPETATLRKDGHGFWDVNAEAANAPKPKLTHFDDEEPATKLSHFDELVTDYKGKPWQSMVNDTPFDLRSREIVEGDPEAHDVWSEINERIMASDEELRRKGSRYTSFVSTQEPPSYDGELDEEFDHWLELSGIVPVPVSPLEKKWGNLDDNEATMECEVLSGIAQEEPEIKPQEEPSIEIETGKVDITFELDTDALVEACRAKIENPVDVALRSTKCVLHGWYKSARSRLDEFFGDNERTGNDGSENEVRE